MSSPLNGKTGEVLRWAIGIGLAGLVYYFTGMGAVQTRIAVLEERQSRLGGDLTEIKADVKQLLRSVTSSPAYPDAPNDGSDPDAPRWRYPRKNFDR